MNKPHDFDPSSTDFDADLGELLHAEVARLPEKYRAPIVLCHLEGRTHEQAAGELNWPVGTVRGRLFRARDLLRKRLARKGVSVASAMLVAALADRAKAAVPIHFITSTTRAATLAATGALAGGVVSVRAIALLERTASAMTFTKLAPITLAALVGLSAAGVGVKAFQDRADDPKKPKQEPKAEAVEAAQKPDAKSDEPSAEASKPTAEPKAADFDKPRSEAVLAQEAFDEILKNDQRPLDPEVANRWSTRWMDAQIADAKTAEERGKARDEHLKRMIDVENRLKSLFAAGVSTHFDTVVAGFFRKQAERNAELVEAAGPINFNNAFAAAYGVQSPTRPTAEPGDSPRGPNPGANGVGRVDNKPGAPGGKGYQPGGKDPWSQAVLAQLDERVNIPFDQETPLEDVIKYIKQATSRGKNDPGIPIYVDPSGLQATDRTLQSTVVICLENVPLRTALRLLLRQLELDYAVEDGILIISSAEELTHILARGPVFDPVYYKQRMKEEEAAQEKAAKTKGVQ